MRPYLAALTGLVLLSCMTVASNETDPDESPKVGQQAPDFTLQDAEDTEYTLKKHQGKVVLLILGNRKIRKEDDKWAEAFQQNYATHKKVVAYIIADMRTVPGFVPKGFIKRQLKKNKPPVTLLLDWKGKVHQEYHTINEKPNLYLINPEGRILFHIQSNFEPKVEKKLQTLIDKALTDEAEK